MNRIVVVTGSCVAGLALIGVGHLYRSELSSGPEPVPLPLEAKAPQEVPVSRVAVPPPAERVAAFLSGIEGAAEQARPELVSAFLEELARPEYAREDLTKDLRKRLRGVVLGVLDTGTEEQRLAAFGLLGRPGLASESAFAKVLELHQQGRVPLEVLPQALRRSGGARSVPVLVELMKSTSDWTFVNRCAVALQDAGDPKTVGEVLARLEAIGTLDSGAKTPWVSGTLFAEWMKTAEGSDFGRGLALLKAKPAMVAQALDAVERGLAHAEPAYRMLAASAVEGAVVGKKLEARTGERLLSQRLELETEPVLKAELSGGLSAVRDLLLPAEQPALEQQPQ